MEEILRAELPNPGFARENWKTLNGVWEFAFDPEDRYQPMGIEKVPFDKTITVPFCYESELSGIHTDTPSRSVWYRREFTVTQQELAGAVLLHFGAVDHVARIWINGAYVGCHEGGFTSFEWEVSQYLKPGVNTLVVKAEDSYSQELPRGKQMWAREPRSCFYRNTTGIWQSVWLEFTGRDYITDIRITPDLDQNRAFFEIRTVNEDTPAQIMLTIRKEAEVLGTMTVGAGGRRTCCSFGFRENGVNSVFDLYWTPEFPNLLDVEVKLVRDGQVLDTVNTYFGMRKIHVCGERIFLNNSLLYQRLVLDQGYWPEGLMTAPSDEAIRKDVELTKAMGFNGARKHQKIEDPRYYYWADKLGLLVWGEMPSNYDFTPEGQRMFLSELQAFVKRDYNHPCIISWIPFNESWGVHQIVGDPMQKAFVKAGYYLLKSLDNTRLVGSNDGWEQLELTDFCGIHDYDITPDNFASRYADIEETMRGSVNFKPVYAKGEIYNGSPIMITEMGGVKLKNDGGWGYNQDMDNEDSMVEYLRGIMQAIRGHGRVRGFCYTQLTDVQQETNGLLDGERVPKVPLEVLRSIFG
ncbi:MAG: glycoside hydrolase family 2 [Ruminococcaceae bacterium]|nr:glycoside hydrolase family 2 [Oscillospiraceae bacterium]